MKNKGTLTIIFFSIIIGIVSLSFMLMTSTGFTRSNEKNNSGKSIEKVDIKSILTQYDEWVDLEPETFTYRYVFGSNKYAFFAHTIEYYKNIDPEMKNEIKSLITIGNYHVKGNIIYLDNGSEEKESLLFKGKGTVHFSDTIGHRYTKNGYYFHSTMSPNSNKYMASKISTIEKNDAVIQELEKLL